jgi:hypothetical protein
MSILRALAAFTVVLHVATPAAARGIRVAAPDVEWAELAPYVRANVVPHLEGDEMVLMICTGVTEGSAVPNFDPSTSDYVKVLLLNRVQRQPALAEDLRRLKPVVMERLRVAGDMSPERVRREFWNAMEERLSALVEAVRSDHERARRKGTVRCRWCADAGWNPAQAG